MPEVTAVTDAAVFSTDAIAPGSLISIFGSNLAPITAAAPSTPLPLSIADVSVTVNGITAPLLFVSPNQINAQTPYEAAPGAASVVVRVQGTQSAPVTMSLKIAAPSLFTDQNSPQTPASPGSSISLYFTGQGPLITSIEDGDAPGAGHTVWASSPVSATIGGLPAGVEYAGLAPNYPGVAQINLKVPTLTQGVYPVIVTIAGVASNAVQVTVPAQ